MTACGGGVRMAVAAAAAAKMAAPWVLGCSLLLCLATFQGECLQHEGSVHLHFLQFIFFLSRLLHVM